MSFPNRARTFGKAICNVRILCFLVHWFLRRFQYRDQILSCNNLVLQQSRTTTFTTAPNSSDHCIIMLVLGQLQRRLASVGRQHYALAAFKTTMAPAISVRASLPLAPAGTQFRKRELSSYSQSNSRSLRAFPQYTIYGVGCVLSVKMISPKFRLVKGDSLAIDPTQKGRILLEFTPQNGQGEYSN